MPVTGFAPNSKMSTTSDDSLFLCVPVTNRIVRSCWHYQARSKGSIQRLQAVKCQKFLTIRYLPLVHMRPRDFEKGKVSATGARATARF